MKRQWKPLLYIAAVLCMSVSCKKQDRTTVVFGTVKDDLGKPIAGIEIVLYGKKGALQSRNVLIKTSATDVKGEYVITHEISKEYHSGDIIPDWFNIDKPLYDKYKEVSSVSFNGYLTKDCCPVSIGEKSQYDFVLVRK
jgi:hypothetical protein